MLISFEGQDGAGKTTVLTAVYEGLKRSDIASVVVDEISNSRYGAPLIDAVARDKFMRPVPEEAAIYLTRALEEIIDLYHLDERVIGPALTRGQVVLKDRHYDTLLYTLVPMLLDARAMPDENTALGWLRGTLSQLRRRPDVTVYVDTPLDVRLSRITGRARSLMEARANQVSAADIRVFARREEIARRLITEEHRPFYLFDNSERPVTEGVQEIIVLVRCRLTASEGRS